MGDSPLMLSYIASKKKTRITVDPDTAVLIKATETGCQNNELNL